MTIKEILNNLYPKEDAIKAEKILQKENFLKHLSTCLELIDQKLSNEDLEIKEYGSIQLCAVASSLLSGVNERLRGIKINNYNKDIEQIIAEMSNKIFEYILEKTKSDKSALINKIAFALHDTCVIFNYDEDKLFESLNYRDLQHYANIFFRSEKVIYKPNSEILRFYSLDIEPAKRNDFFEIFSFRELISKSSKKQLPKLFESSSIPLTIELNPDKIRLTMTLFYWLKKHNHIKTTGHDGFYKPLCQHIIGFQEKHLENLSPGDYNDRLKKNKKQWAANSTKIEKWLKNIFTN